MSDIATGHLDCLKTKVCSSNGYRSCQIDLMPNSQIITLARGLHFTAGCTGICTTGWVNHTVGELYANEPIAIRLSGPATTLMASLG